MKCDNEKAPYSLRLLASIEENPHSKSNTTFLKCVKKFKTKFQKKREVNKRKYPTFKGTVRRN